MVLGQDLITACHGYMDSRLMVKLQARETLEDNIIGFGLDDWIKNWRAALVELADGNADLILPRMEP
jgi:hypothetical protein